jgi:Zn-finger nucleic acid-binding protein
MEQVTCPNCNVDVDPEELKRNLLRCPTCGFDLSGSEDQDVGEDEDSDEEEAEDEDEEEEA